MNTPATPTRRLFFALWPDHETAEHLEMLSRSLAPRGAKPVHEHQLHMTLLFLGAVIEERLPLVMEAADKIQAEGFDITLDKLGFWPRGGVLYAGCRDVPSRQQGGHQAGSGPQRLRRLFDLLKASVKAAGFHVDSRPYVPHVTLARRVRGLDLPRLATPMSWPVTEFALVESHLHQSGARYRTIANWPLAEPD
jgi:2'-5' RNA ligase